MSVGRHDTNADSCYLCGRPAPRLVIANDAYSYVLCSACGYRRRDPIPSQEVEEHLYEQDYYADRGLVVGLDHQPSLMKRLINERVAALSELNHGPGDLLDVGAGTGLFMEASMRAGWHAVGLETSLAAAHIASTITRGPLITGRLEDQRFDQPFDAVTFWDVVEHLADPRATLKAARQVLKPRGLVGISLPNVAGLKSRLQGNGWRYYQHSFGHISHFSPRTLSMLLEQAGFKVERIATSGAFNVGKLLGLDPAAVEESHALLRRLQAASDGMVSVFGLGESMVAYARVAAA